MTKEEQKIMKINCERGRTFKFTGRTDNNIAFINSCFAEGLNIEVEPMSDIVGHEDLFYISIYQYNEKERFNNYVGMLCDVKHIYIDNPNWTCAKDMDEEIIIKL